MPKLKPSELEIQNRNTRAVISHNMEKYGVTEQEIAKRMNCTVRTVQNKRSKPETFTMPELRLWIKLLKITDEQLPEFIGKD